MSADAGFVIDDESWSCDLGLVRTNGRFAAVGRDQARGRRFAADAGTDIELDPAALRIAQHGGGVDGFAALPHQLEFDRALPLGFDEQVLKHGAGWPFVRRGPFHAFGPHARFMIADPFDAVQPTIIRSGPDQAERGDVDGML